MPDDKTEKPKGDVTEARSRAEVAEMRAKLAEEIAAEALAKAKEDENASAEKWKMIREFVTGPNLKWFLAMIVIIALVGASMFSGKVFTVSQGGIVFGATQVVPTPEEGGEPEEGPTHDTAAAVPAPVEAEPTVVTRVVEKIVEVPAPPPPGYPPPPPPGYHPPPVPVAEPEPMPEPEPEPEPLMEPEPEPLPE